METKEDIKKCIEKEGRIELSLEEWDLLCELPMKTLFAIQDMIARTFNMGRCNGLKLAKKVLQEYMCLIFWKGFLFVGKGFEKEYALEMAQRKVNQSFGKELGFTYRPADGIVFHQGAKAVGIILEGDVTVLPQSQVAIDRVT